MIISFEVSSCADCPCNTVAYDGDHCSHPNAPHLYMFTKEYEDTETVHPECPGLKNDN